VTTLRWAAATDVGRRRRNNQDKVLAAEPLFAVADGMGGHAGGEIAAVTAVEALKASFSRKPSADALEQAVRDANRAVCDRAEGQPDLRNMGTTITAMALVDDQGDELFAIANVGDSRAYLLRDSELTQLTDDHSVPQELFRAGQLSEAEAAIDPRRNQLTRVLGMSDAEPDMQSLLPYRGDRLLLCSDGLYNEVDDGEIASVLRRVADPDEVARRLIEMANDRGGNDNISVVIVDVVDDDDRAGAASAALAHEPPPSRSSTTGLMSAQERNAQLRSLARDRDEEPAHPRAPREGAPAPLAMPARRVTGRVVAFVTVLVLLVAAGVGAIAWYARGSYFVGLHEGRVTIYKGRPGGLLWFDPTVEEATPITSASLLPARRDDLEAGKPEPSLADARLYVERIQQEAARAGASGGDGPAATSTTTTEATTVSPTSTVQP
jgi:serine/threonine protein phosphatase PrpC